MFPTASTSLMALRQTAIQSSRSLPSTVSSSSFHTSATLSAESKRKRLARLRKQANQARRAEAAEEARQTAPDLMLGYNPSSAQGQQLWANSKLNKILLRPEQVWGLSMAQARQSTQSAPSLDEGLEPEQSPATSDSDRVWNFGLKSDEAQILFKALPEVNTQRLQTTDPVELQAGAVLEDNKVDQIKRILDLKNANAKGIDVENKRRIVEAFGHKSADSKPDTGCPEVQGAILTARIHNIRSHLRSANLKDIPSQNALRHLINQRVKVFRYLKQLSLARYVQLLQDCGLDERAVVGQPTITRDMVRGLKAATV